MEVLCLCFSLSVSLPPSLFFLLSHTIPMALHFPFRWWCQRMQWLPGSMDVVSDADPGTSTKLSSSYSNQQGEVESGMSACSGPRLTGRTQNKTQDKGTTLLRHSLNLLCILWYICLSWSNFIVLPQLHIFKSMNWWPLSQSLSGKISDVHIIMEEKVILAHRFLSPYQLLWGRNKMAEGNREGNGETEMARKHTEKKGT